MISELSRMIDQVSREKGVEREVLIGALEEAMKAAAKKKYGPDYDLEVNFNEDLGEIEVFEFKEVVENVELEHLQVSLEEGRKLDPDVELGDSLGIKMDTNALGRIAAQSAKQVIMQRLKEAERDIVYDDFKDRQGEIINGIVQRFDRGAIIVNLGRTEGELPAREQIPRETYKQGDRIRAYILDIKHFSRGPQVILSRTHPNLVACLFENEVPEISEGIVQIMQVSRDPGSRSKIAVVSKDSDVDPVGACVGMKGSRVQAVVQELRGEKIDIVPWDPDAAKFICNALAPAEVIRVIVDEEKHAMEIVVPDDQLPLAIGKKGQNVRLASKLTGWRLDVLGETNYNQALKDGYRSLLDLPGVGAKRASELYDIGFRSVEDVASAIPDDLLAVQGLGKERAQKLIENAVEYIKRKKTEPENQDPVRDEYVSDQDGDTATDE
ncbi:transcription termination/antitermination L factor [uncultured Desulfobacterium sp.]|uniref:Transcription termination/antitermination protein NusA n=1 Tax=uncultured Desulfobacterium sp. TaxID=201089 RepID=A0A445MZK2_9BACT|nr:transcription termination/antitermination L factor [uncultured Desulfobacterium sp.]